MVRDHDSNGWNLRHHQEAIRKEIYGFESALVTSHPPQNLHPTLTFHTGATNNPSQPNAASQHSCAFAKDLTPLQTVKGSPIVKPVKNLWHKNFCFNCLGRHKVSVCKSKHQCHKCNQKHHTSLCTAGNGPEKQDNKN